MKMRTNYFLLFFLLAACGGEASKEAANTDHDSATKANAPVSAADAIPRYRDTVQKEPVAQYRVKTENPLNDWYFSVRLFETRRTFHYLIQLQFEEISGTDTLKLPNFGTMPEPVIRQGPEKFSCIVGFLDKEKQFREYKKVYVKDGHLKITALKHYAVATYQDQDPAE